ncbi:tryptophan-rich sensory protein [Chitinophaga dinghuensis]|uniref:Tryptophan-rich sensory protein n=1 Tax=Chitinophaga dinghuensis TaxID=1539050 RepID=A0A327W0W4_9BACT|nr:TspO/MBR family protein [Chitinophaga dinghuensis]RAJ82293.1 tryptophan-rich sensory protein [Chitinophaga dinghuensis]
MRNNWLIAACCIALPMATGAIAAYVTIQNVQFWYPVLRKPIFTPPNAVFAPVWTILYVLMGISLYLVLREPPSPKRRLALVLFGIQLFFNFWWSILFFRFHSIGIALLDIILLWLFIILMIRQFYRLSNKAANLQWPYLAWVSFASVLNFSIWYLN